MIKSVLSVKLSGVQIGIKLNFKENIDEICKSARNQLNAIERLKSFLEPKDVKALIDRSF